MENTQKTPEQWFQMLKEPYRSEAIANIDKTHYDYKDFQKSLYDSLMDSFRWKDTKQGLDYWQDVYTSINRGETTYLEPETLKPEQMESGKWYVVDDFLIKFEKIEDERIYRYKSFDLECKLNFSNIRDGFLCIKNHSKIRHATKEEVLKYFPDEVFEPEQTDWEAKYNELKVKYDQLEPKGEKVYFYFDKDNENVWTLCPTLQVALNRADENQVIYEAYCIGKKKSVLVNE